MHRHRSPLRWSGVAAGCHRGSVPGAGDGRLPPDLALGVHDLDPSAGTTAPPGRRSSQRDWGTRPTAAGAPQLEPRAGALAHEPVRRSMRSPRLASRPERARISGTRVASGLWTGLSPPGWTVRPWAAVGSSSSVGLSAHRPLGTRVSDDAALAVCHPGSDRAPAVPLPSCPSRCPSPCEGANHHHLQCPHLQHHRLGTLHHVFVNVALRGRHLA